jgi:hypothetical protein
MTDDLPGDWDDERLAVAFARRAAAWPGRPTGLDQDILEAIRARSGSLAGRPRWAWSLVGLAAVLVAATVVGVRAVLPAVPAASQHPTSSGPSTAASGSTAPSASLDEPMSVMAALSLRNATGDDREIAVAGFLSDDPVLPCPFIPGPENPTLIHCPETFQWLMERPEVLWSTTGGETHGGPPVGPAFHPSFAIVDSPIPRNAGAASTAVPVVLVGHFHDRRAALCRTDPPPDPPCAETLVVDRVALANGAARAVATRLDNQRFDAATQAEVAVEPVSAAADVDALVTAAAPGVTVLSRQLVAGEGLAAVEPALASDLAWTGQRLIWIVTVADMAGDHLVPRTFLIVDGTSVVDEIAASGVTTIAGSPPGSVPPAPNGTAALGDLLAHPITVADAIDRRDHHLDDTELAVRGFGWAPGFISCTMIRSGMPALDQCPSGFTWLAARVPPPATGNELLRPDGPAFNLLLQPETSYGMHLSGTPTDTIALGHFDDHRATACPADLLERCRRNFVVDALVDPNAAGGAAPGPTDARIDPNLVTVATRDDAVRTALATILGGGTPIAVFARPGNAIAGYEPIAAGTPDLTSAKAVWVVRALGVDKAGRTVLVTRLIVDGSADEMRNRIYEPKSDGLGRIVVIVD